MRSTPSFEQAMKNPWSTFRTPDVFEASTLFTAEQREARVAAGSEKLKVFIAANAIPWPQHYDGMGMENRIQQRLGIKCFPARLLLDRQGRVVESHVQTRELEAAVEDVLRH